MCGKSTDSARLKQGCRACAGLQTPWPLCSLTHAACMCLDPFRKTPHTHIQIQAMSEAVRNQTAGLQAGGSSSGRDVAPASATTAAAAAAAAGMPPGMPDMSAMMTPEMMNMAMEMMKNMRPEDMAAMSQVAAGGGANMSAAGGWV